MQTFVPNFLLVFIKMLCYNLIEGAKVDKRGQKCVLYERECIGCLECEICDSDEGKICDNCGKCLNIQDDAIIKIDKIIMEEDED